MRRATRSVLATAALLVATAGLAGCGLGAVSTDELEETIGAQLTEEVGSEPDAVDCPDTLDAEVGATTTCVLTVEETEYDVAVEVTSVEDDTANFSIEVLDPAEG